MSRLIDGDALKRKYEDHKRLFCRNRIEFSTLSDKDKARVDELDNCIADILNEPTIDSEPKWIPCSKRLPEETEASYWVCTDGGYQCQCRWTNDVFGLGEGDTWTWKIFDIPQYSKVIAWMPLPEPWKEGEK